MQLLVTRQADSNATIRATLGRLASAAMYELGASPLREHLLHVVREQCSSRESSYLCRKRWIPQAVADALLMLQDGDREWAEAVDDLFCDLGLPDSEWTDEHSEMSEEPLRQLQKQFAERYREQASRAVETIEEYCNGSITTANVACTTQIQPRRIVVRAPMRCRRARSSRRARVQARRCTTKASTADPEPEPDIGQRVSSSGGAL